MAQVEPMALVYATCPDLDTAETMARALVEDEQIACANIVPGMVSVYRWEGKIERGTEVILIAKTRASSAIQVRDAIVARHPYDVPAVFIVPVESAHPEFLQWLCDSTRAPKAR